MAARRLVLLVTGLNLGGAESQVIQLALRFKQRGWGVSVVSMIPPSERAQVLEAAGIPVHSLHMKPGIPTFSAMQALAAVLKREQPQVLHAHMVHANFLARAVRLLTKVPLVVATAHNINEGARWREWVYRLTEPLGDLTTQVSEAGLKRYIEVGAASPQRIIFMPNGVDTAQFAPNPAVRQAKRQELGLENHFIWLAVGRLTEAKDYPNLLQAFARLYPQNPQARLLIAGKGEDAEALKAQTQQMGLDKVVQWLGPRNDIPQLMNAADGYVMSSAWEGMPMVLLEAAANALPIVTTDVGGNREMLQVGKTGFLAPMKDPEALAGAMQQVMQLSPEARAAMGAASREFIQQHFDLEKVVDRWEALYTERLARRGVQLET